MPVAGHTLQVRFCSKSAMWDVNRTALASGVVDALGGKKAGSFLDAPRRAGAAREYCDLRAS